MTFVVLKLIKKESVQLMFKHILVNGGSVTKHGRLSTRRACDLGLV